MSLTNHVRVKLGAGDDAREFELKPSLKAANAVSSRFGGFTNALGAVANNDLQSINFIVRQGVQLKAISSNDLEQAVYEAGTRNIMGDVMKYVSRLANGGRDPAESEEDDDDAVAGNEGNDGEV